MSKNTEGKQFQLALSSLSPTKQQLGLIPIRDAIQSWMEQLSGTDDFSPQKNEKEMVITFWNFGTVEDDE